MKRRAVHRAGAIMACALALSLVPACAAPTTADEGASSEQTVVNAEAMLGVEGTPPLQPADHANRAERPASRCYGCHGAGSQANPQLADATALPDDHYANGDVESTKLEPAREQCITCHPVA